MSSLNSNKAFCPNNLPYRMLFLLKNGSSKQLVDLFSLSFMTGVFLLYLKLQKQFLFSRKIQNQIIATIVQSPCYQILKKYLKNLCIYKRFYTFLNNNGIYILQFGFRQQFLTSYNLIIITENIRKALDDGNISCGVFVEQWPSGEGTGFPTQGSCVQNH